MERTKRSELEHLANRLSRLTGQPIILNHHQPGDARYTWYITSPVPGTTGETYSVWGETRYTARELADALRLAIRAVEAVR